MKKTGNILQQKVTINFLVPFHHLQFRNTPDCTKLPQSTTNSHFLWDDIQLSKSGWNKDRQVDVLLSGKREKLMYRIASCKGVKLCPVEACEYVAPISAQRSCSVHSNYKPIKSNDKERRPLQFAYTFILKIVLITGDNCLPL